MTMNNYADYARSFGYEVRFMDLGMSYVALGSLQITKIMDDERTEKELALIGMAIMQDTMRK